MDYDGFAENASGSRLTQDEQAVLDHVSGLTPVLPEPTGPGCEDRQHVGELMAMRSRLGAMAIHPPKMKLRLDDVLAAADSREAGLDLQNACVLRRSTPQLPTENRVVYWITGRWGIGLVTAASVCLAVLTGAIATGELRSLFSSGDVSPSLAQADSKMPDAAAPGDQILEPPPPNSESPVAPATFGAITRQGSLHLKHENPAEIQQRVTELVTSLGGHVTSLTRQGSGELAEIDVAVAIPAGRYREFKGRVSEFGEVLNETESTEDVSAEQVDLKARLTEAEDYLDRLDKLIETPTDLSALQNLEQERRKTRLEIEQYRQALSALESRVAHSRLDIHVTAAAPDKPEEQGAFIEAWEDGVDGLEDTGAFLLKTGVAGSPVLLIGALAYLTLRRKRKKLNRERRQAA